MKRGLSNYIFMGIVLLEIVGVLAFMVFMVTRCTADFREVKERGDEVTTRTVNLRSINYTGNAQGTFFLGCGSVNGVDYYICYEILEDGGLSLLRLRASQTVIYETLDEGETAYAEISENGWGALEGIKLYVPVNAIQVEYDLSLN